MYIEYISLLLKQSSSGLSKLVLVHLMLHNSFYLVFLSKIIPNSIVIQKINKLNIYIKKNSVNKSFDIHSFNAQMACYKGYIFKKLFFIDKLFSTFLETGVVVLQSYFVIL